MKKAGNRYFITCKKQQNMIIASCDALNITTRPRNSFSEAISALCKAIRKEFQESNVIPIIHQKKS